MSHTTHTIHGKLVQSTDRARLRHIISNRAMSHCWTQEFVKVGVECWVLHPNAGIKPVGEGIAGDKPVHPHRGEGIGRSLLRDLCESDQQMVKVTKLHKKKTELMYPEDNALSKYLDDYMDPPAFVTWSTRYLVPKADDH